MFEWLTKRGRWLHNLQLQILVAGKIQCLSVEQTKRIKAVFELEKRDFQVWYEVYIRRQQGLETSIR